MGLKSGVFIIESNEMKEEDESKFEGKILMEMLNLIGINVQYKYIRTTKELKAMINKFQESNYKYLHIACHGNEQEIGLTLEEDGVAFESLGKMFKGKMEKRRLFLSSCSVMKGNRIEKGLLGTNFISITGPTQDIYFSDAVVFWVAFYHNLFSEKRKKKMKKIMNADMKAALETFSSTFNIKLCTLFLNENRDKYIRKEFLSNE
ncbi:hypothetical protein [Bacillus sp. SBS7]|uniref:hypothetical protein n=1 Tax=Bacillus sp. SBS7 TaxID=3401756 RepID=UPI003AA9464D